MNLPGTFWAAVRFLSALAAVSAHAAVTVAPAEMALKTDWVKKNLLAPAKPPPFSFTFDGKPSPALLRSWKRVTARRTLDANRTERVITWTEAASGLVVKCVGVEYSDYPVVEWTVFFKNTGTKDSPILENLQGLDTFLQRSSAGEFVLNGIKGDFCAADSFQPYQVTLGTNVVRKFAPPPISGKSSDGPDGWPYYNLQMPGGGIIMAVGWPGQWASSFTRVSGGAKLVENRRFEIPGKTRHDFRLSAVLVLELQGGNCRRGANGLE